VRDGEREEGSSQTASRVDDDYLTVTMLAAGLAGIFGRRARGGNGDSRSDGLLPEAWRMAFARLWWRSQEQDVPPLDSDLDLLALCTQPFAVWPVPLSLSESDMQSCLIADEELSVFAEQGARVALADVEAEWTENRVYQALRTVASANGGGDGKEVERVYAVLRRRLVDHPVLADLELKRWEREFQETDGSGQTYVQRLIDAAYVPRPVSGVQQYLRCPGCCNTVPGQASVCGTPGCPGGAPETASVTTLAVIYEQHRATRRFIHDPGSPRSGASASSSPNSNGSPAKKSYSKRRPPPDNPAPESGSATLRRMLPRAQPRSDFRFRHSLNVAGHIQVWPSVPLP
jgi:hypothetical protein